MLRAALRSVVPCDLVLCTCTRCCVLETQLERILQIHEICLKSLPQSSRDRLHLHSVCIDQQEVTPLTFDVKNSFACTAILTKARRTFGARSTDVCRLETRTRCACVARRSSSVSRNAPTLKTLKTLDSALSRTFKRVRQ